MTEIPVSSDGPWGLLSESVSQVKTLSPVVLNTQEPMTGCNLSVLLRPDGGLHSKILNNDIVMLYTFEASPPDLKFVTRSNGQIDPNSKFTSYKLIFNGTDGKTMSMSYVEYSAMDAVRPALQQSYLYDASKKQIHFKDSIIQVQEITGDKIDYTVISDGLSD
jgi:hypothetical protein